MITLLFFFLLIFSCATQNVQAPAIDVTSDAIYYTKPIVRSADVSLTDEGFYEKKGNGFSSTEIKQTKETFFRDFKFEIYRSNYPWKILNDPTEALLHSAYNSFANITSLRPDVQERLISDSVHFLILVYNLRSSNQKTVSVTSSMSMSSSGKLVSYGPIQSAQTNLYLDCKVAIFDVIKNEVIHSFPFYFTGHDPLTFSEKAIKKLVNQIVHGNR